MSSIGKIFVFVNLVLAGLFVGWAAKALNENSDWKAKHDTVRTDLTAKLDAANKDLGSTICIGSGAATRYGVERLKPLGKVQLRGLNVEMAVYEPKP